MKALALITLLTTGLLTSQLSAQEEDRFSIGPRVGVNFANVSNVDDSKSLVGLQAGLTSTYSFNESSGLTVDVLYSQEGFKNAADQELSLDYIQIPIYYNLFFNDLGEAFRPKVYVGVAPGFLMNAELEDLDVSDMATGVVLSVSGGLGFNYRIANRVWLNTDVRAFLGLSDIWEEEFRVIDDKIAARNVGVSLGVAFGL